MTNRKDNYRNITVEVTNAFHSLINETAHKQLITKSELIRNAINKYIEDLNSKDNENVS